MSEKRTGASLLPPMLHASSNRCALHACGSRRSTLNMQCMG